VQNDPTQPDSTPELTTSAGAPDAAVGPAGPDRPAHPGRPARPGRSGRRRGIAAGLTLALVGGGLLAAGITRTGPFGGGGTGAGDGGGEPGPRTSAVAYSTFSDCSALLGYLTKHGRDLVGPYGLPGTGYGMGVGGGIAFAERLATDGAPAPAAGGADTSAAGAPDTRSGTGTNVQVAGVDEADLAKRVGDLVYSAAPSDKATFADPSGTKLAGVPALTVVRTRDGRSTPLGRLTLDGWQPTGLLVDGATVLLVGYAPPTGGIDPRAADVSPRSMPYWGWLQRTRIVQVDVSDPSSPRVVRSLDVDGSSVGVRLVDGVARIAVSGATHRLVFRQPQFDQGVVPGSDTPVAPGPVVAPPYDEAAVKKAERTATADNRRIVAASRIEDWLPTYELTEGTATKPTKKGSLLSCSDIAAPSRFSGLETMSLLTFDLRDPAGISRWDGAGVVATGAQLYATADRTYVATTPWQNWAGMPITQAVAAMRAQRSQIHLFDTTGGASPVYVGSGEVAGFLLNQFSMDEFEGHLRVASTSTPEWWSGDADRTPSSSQVTVLRVGDDGLTVTGKVAGLGKTETIRAVRFIGHVGYVVTFRQTDPLYTVDLTDPAAPRVAGELKILGYSAYLHPVGDGLVLGVGQDADPDGRVKGLQMALFDVSDPASPRRVDRVTMPGAWSDVEGDHHAFTFADGLALVPFTRYVDPGTDVEGGVVPPDSGSAEPATGASTQPDAGSGSAPAAGTSVLPVQTFDAGVVAVRLGSDRRFGSPVVLRATGDGPQVVDQRTGYPGPTPLRTFVGDGSIWTVTTGGIAAHDTDTLRRTDFTVL